jgi:hypothetical protein
MVGEENPILIFVDKNFFAVGKRIGEPRVSLVAAVAFGRHARRGVALTTH